MPTQPPEPKQITGKPLDYVEPVDVLAVDSDERAVDDGVVIEYATSDRQRRLREKIESQDLPVNRDREKLASVVEHAITSGNGITLLQGETGSGKSLYTPLIVRKLLRKLDRKLRVVVMQPRRDAASGVARAMAALADEELGGTIGFSTSEIKAVRSNSQISVITPGIFLRHLMSGDLRASEVGAIIVDELHEGSIDYHLALGLMKLMQQGGELPPTVLTSATMNREGVQEFFDIPDDQYVRIEGRAHPVDSRYAEKAHEATQGKYEYIRLAAEEVKKACAAKGGDILVFMPGAREINDCIKQVGTIPGVEVIPMHGGLTPKDRDYALSGDKPSGVRRRVIVATNIAETSVTVPGVTLVVDTCRERSVRYNPQTGIQELGTGFISKDQAQQRAGRAGRVQPGECVRVVTAEQFRELPEHPESEIRRSNLSHVILRLMRLGIEPTTFPFIEPPDAAALTGGEEELKALGALSEDASLTDRGRQMGEMPFEPRIARMLIEAKERKCLEATLVLAAFEREGDVLMGPSRRDEEVASGFGEKEKRLNARKKVQGIQNRFDRGGSDWLKALNVFAEALENGVVEAMRRDNSPEGRVAQQRFRKWCDQYYIRAEALTHIAYRLQDYARYAGTQLDFRRMKKSLAEAKDIDLGCVILASHPGKILYLASTGRGLPSYYPLTGGRGNEINMSPGSEGFDSQPKLCIAADISQGRGSGRKGAEIVRNYANGVHPISLEVLREALPHMIEERRNSLRYDTTSDQVVVEIVLYPKGNSSIELGKEDRVVEGTEATVTFARALAYGQVDLPCVAHNKTLLEQLQALQHRSRGQVQPPTDMTTWYVEHLGGVYRKSEATYVNDELQLQLEDFYPEALQEETDRLYPETVTVGGEQLPIRYDFRAAQERWGEAERFTATVTLTEDQVDLFEQSDIPQLGSDEQPLPLTLEASIGWNTTTDTNINNLKDALDERRIQQAWDNWEKPEAKPVAIKLLQPLPSCAELGCAPIAYATNRSGESVLAYPAFTTNQQYDSTSRQYVDRFTVAYYRNQTEADSANQYAVAKKTEVDAAEQRRLDRETLLAPVQELYTRVEPRVAAVIKDYDQFGFGYSEAQGLNTQLQEANMSIQGRDRWGSTREVDPRKAQEILQVIEQTLADRERSRQSQSELYKQATVVRDRVQQVVTEKLAGNRFRYYGLAEERGRALQAQWDTAVRMLSKFTPGQTTDTFNPEEAMRVMPGIEQALVHLELNTSPLQVAFLEMLDQAGSSARLLEVRGGVAVRSSGMDGQNDTLQVNTGEKYKGELRRMTMRLGVGNTYVRGRELSHWSGIRRNTLYAHYQLADGLYAVGSQGEVYAVQRRGNELVAQHQLESLRVGYDQGVAPEGVATWGEMADQPVQPESVDSPFAALLKVTVKDSPKAVEPSKPVGPAADANALGQLAAAFGGDKGKKKAGMSELTIEVPAQVVEAPVRPPVLETKSVEAEVMTPELLANFANQVEVLQNLIGQLKTLGEKPKLKSGERPTDKEKALQDLYDKLIPGLNDAIRNVRGELVASNPRPERIRGLVADLRRRVDSAWDKTGSRTIPGYRIDWTHEYLGAWESIPAVVDTEETAILAVEMGLDKASLVAEVRTELTKLIPRLQKEAAESVLDLQKIVADVASRLS